MPFLLGAIGKIAQTPYTQKLATLAEQEAQKNSLQTITTTNEFIISGYKTDEEYLSDKIIPLMNNRGIFIGKMFDQHNHAPAIFNEADSTEVSQNPKLILKKWWGRYIGVVFNQQTQSSTLVRDPQGLSTLFYIIKPNGILFSSHLHLLYDALEEKPSVNISFFAEYAINTNNASSRTPFENILELQPGMGLTLNFNGTHIIKNLWDVSGFKGEFITDQQAVEEELLATLRATTKAWAQDSSGVCVELSGGADSSGVMILLRDVLPDLNLIGVNYFDSKTPSSNEIPHAQEVADACNAPLHFIDWQTTPLLTPLPSSWRPDRPTSLFLSHSTSNQLRAIATKNNCSEIMNGQGGDHVFLAPQPAEALADYWLDKGFRGIGHPMKEISASNRMPWSTLARDSVKDVARYYGNKQKTTKIDAPVITPAYLAKHKETDFYLKDHLKGFYPGKIKHIQALSHGVMYADRSQRINGYTMTHPLLSQPLIELALKIPTYQSFNNGFDRIFFRNAVSRIKKPQALWRTLKGETTGSMIKELSGNASIIHDMILAGRLAQSGMVNTQWLTEQITKVRHGQADNLWPIIHLLTSQLWLNQWKL